MLCIYSDIIVGDYVLCAEQAAYSGPGCIATLRCHCMRLPPDGWWPLAVAGGVRTGRLCRRTCFSLSLKSSVYPAFKA